jgi:FkbM family methyltransferase
MDRMRSENLGHLAELVIPAKIGLTKRFFSEPGLPPNLKRLRRRAISSAYVRAVDYLQVNQPRHWFWAVRLLARAMVTDPLNILAISERTTRPFRYHSARLLRRILRQVFGILAAVVTGVGTRVLRVIAAPLAVPRRRLGRVVERLFVRGNRELTLKIDSLHRRVAAAEKATSAALEPVASRIDRIAAEVPRLTDALESLRREHDVRIAAVERAIPEALQPMATQLEALRKELNAAQERPPKLSDALSEVYGAPPSLRPIPGWHTYWGIENGSDRFLRGRAELWSSLKRPVLMRWLADLLVMIWPGNELSRVLFLTGNFEPNELTWLSETLTEGMTMIDIGAHMGMYTLTASKLVGESGIVVALEPSTREFQRLTFHVTLNDLRNVRCLQVAASSACGEAALKIAWEWNSGHNTFGEFFNPAVEMTREERVPMQTVDALVAAQRLQRVDVIKIDVEGHELQVLAGTVETLTRFRPRVLIEVCEETLRRQGASAEAVLGFLTKHGYVLSEFSEVNGCLVPLARSPGNESRNVVATPK